MYLEHGIVKTFIDIPVDTAFQKPVEIKCDELSPDNIKDLMEYLETHLIVKTYAQAIKWGRLFGGAGLIINAGQKTDKQFDINKIKNWTPLEFYPVDRWELSYMPKGIMLDQFTDMLGEVPYNYYGHQMHRSQVIKIDGKQAPSLIRGQFGGWGVSELEHVVQSFNNYQKWMNVVFELLDEAKIDVYSIEGFNSSLVSPKGTELTSKRISFASQLKNYQNALVLDKNDAYEQKQISFGGLPEMLNEIRKGIACDLRIPMTRLFGITSSGLHDSDEDIEIFNQMVETEIRSKYKGGLIELMKIVCQKLFGFVPDTLNFEWQPLRELTHKDESELQTQALNRIIAAQQNGLMTTEASIEQINSEKIFINELDPNEGLSVEEMTEIKGGSLGTDVSVPASSNTVL
jgi:hypothetical protein